MLQHDDHKCACATSLTFTFSALAFEVLPLKAAECMGQRKTRLDYVLKSDCESRK